MLLASMLRTLAPQDVGTQLRAKNQRSQGRQLTVRIRRGNVRYHLVCLSGKRKAVAPLTVFNTDTPVSPCPPIRTANISFPPPKKIPSPRPCACLFPFRVISVFLSSVSLSHSARPPHLPLRPPHLKRSHPRLIRPTIHQHTHPRPPFPSPKFNHQGRGAAPPSIQSCPVLQNGPQAIRSPNTTQRQRSKPFLDPRQIQFYPAPNMRRTSGKTELRSIKLFDGERK